MKIEFSVGEIVIFFTFTSTVGTFEAVWFGVQLHTLHAAHLGNVFELLDLLVGIAVRLEELDRLTGSPSDDVRE